MGGDILSTTGSWMSSDTRLVQSDSNNPSIKEEKIESTHDEEYGSTDEEPKGDLVRRGATRFSRNGY